MRRASKAKIVFRSALARIDPEARRALLMEGAQCAVRTGTLASKGDAVRGDNIGQRPFAFEGVSVDTPPGVSRANHWLTPFGLIAAPRVARRAARTAPTEPWPTPLVKGTALVSGTAAA